MRYCIKADTTKWPSSRIPLPYNDLADCFGNIEIDFSYDSKVRSYENKFVNIPLFLTELEDFLNRICSESPQQWYLGFAPFAYGLLHKGSLLISTGDADDFHNCVFDIMNGQELANLRMRVAKDFLQYGKVQMDLRHVGEFPSDI